MEVSPLKTRRSYDKNGFSVSQKQEHAINYLIDSEAEQQRRLRWQKLLPRIQQLKDSGKQGERRLVIQVRRGIQDSLRPKIWPLLIQSPVKSFQQSKNKCEVKDINLDLDRTFPTHKEAKSLQQRMKEVLNALAYALPKVGYCQGMNFVVGTLLLKLGNEQAYNVAYHIFHWQRHEQLLTNLGIIHQKLYVLDKIVEKRYPQLFAHLKTFEVDSILYASSWFITIYCNSLPTSYALRVLECFLMEGEKVIYRVALQILQMKKRDLKKLNKVERIVEQLKNYGDLLESDIDSFFDSMYGINLSRNQINHYLSQFRQKQSSNKLQ